MQYLTAAALYFILWWLVLFAVLPFSVRTQEEEGDITLGTVRSAPRGNHAGRAMLWTTLWSALLFGAIVGTVLWFDLSFEDIPRMIPDFG